MLTYVSDTNFILDIFGLKKKSKKPKVVETKSTGRTKARGKNETYVLDHVRKHPENGSIIIESSKINDPCFRGKGWNKMSQTINEVEVHYMAKFDNKGKMIEVSDFKIKCR